MPCKRHLLHQHLGAYQISLQPENGMRQDQVEIKIGTVKEIYAHLTYFYLGLKSLIGCYASANTGLVKTGWSSFHLYTAACTK